MILHKHGRTNEVASTEEGFLVYEVWQGHILLCFFLPLIYQPLITAVPIMLLPDNYETRVK